MNVLPEFASAPMAAAAAVAALLALPGVASAAPPAVQVRVCNGVGTNVSFFLRGINQNGSDSSYPAQGLDAGRCHFASGWWWRQANVSWFTENGSGRTYLPGNLRDGSTVTLTLKN
ncbi:hypothetical protein SK571_42950 [Lentzea sp. BCCO 10_0798]|uniref:Beta/Gamma crystallin n=1 Tax=Lentzea kristufekii TaxID=3095430 RepID=A0ABU4U752_9PSEU|nr:hypothetical protein [Lentzea sp. BCCO 10_0798]MDX8056175.1 hypothetical protein [Lentzea sp. BCCO 10_0798]